VGIECVCARSAQKKELYWEFIRDRITEDSIRALPGALRKCKGVHKREPKFLNILWENILRQEGVEKVCRQAWKVKRTL
jgi:hypothetical protein